MGEIAERLDQLRRRLLAANLRSRSIRLVRPSRSGAFDLSRLARLEQSALSRVVGAMGLAARHTIPLLPVKPEGEEVREAAEDLRQLANAARRTWMEVGENELLLGWPLIEAKLAETWLRAPLLLYPIELARSARGHLTWNLTFDGRPDVNEVLTQALYRLGGVRLDLDRLLELDDDQRLVPDPPTWAALRAWLLEGGVALEAGAPEPGDFEPLVPREEAERNAFPSGTARLTNALILGRFPQSSSNVLNEYNELAERLELLAQGPAAELLAVEVGAASPGRTHAEIPDQPEPLPAAREPPADSRDVRVLGSDASQEAVIRALDGLAGQGLVVRGPPGTGKSQLIANLVGQAIHRNERLLVVCQKRAALDVVAQRLATVGLAEPLALVHDVHRDRQAFCQAVAGTLGPVIEADPGLDATELERAGARVLDRYGKARRLLGARLEAGRLAYRAMMAPGPGGRTLADLLERALDDDGRVLPDLAAVAPEAVRDVTEEAARLAMPQVESAAADARRFAAPHPLAWRTDWAGLDAPRLEQVRGELERLCALVAACVSSPDASMSPGEARAHDSLWTECAPLLDLFESGDTHAHDEFALFWQFTDAGRANSGFEAIVARLERGLGELADVPPGLFATATPTVVDWISDLEKLAELRGRWWRFTLPRFWRLRRRPADLMDRAGIEAGPVPVDLVGLCRMTLKWHALVREVGDLQADYPFFELGCTGRRGDVRRALDEVRLRHELVGQVHRLHERLGAGASAYASLPEFDPKSPTPYRELPFFRTAVADRDQARRLAAAKGAADALSRAFHRLWLDGCLGGAERGHPDSSAIDRALAAWNDAQAVAQLDRRQAGLPDWARAFLRFYAPGAAAAPLRPDPSSPDAPDPFSGFDPGRLEADALLALERAWRLLALAGRSAAQSEAALVDASQRDALADAYAEMVEASGPAVLAGFRGRLRSAARDPATARHLRRLLSEVRKRRGRRSIRQLVEAHWSVGLAQARPVWLCSPESVAALFPLEAGLFDQVVLDEASQCPVESALPALVRGRRVVVAGDEKQMPPSHFFAARDDEEADNDDDETSALLAAESILDVARVAYAGTMLRFHYRSRHEELITFSNHAFYGGRLVTAPPADRHLRDFEGVHFIEVDGRWTDQTNRIEAEHVVDRIVELLGERLPNGERPSLGVVTFNRKQRALVESLLDARLEADPAAREVLHAEWERHPSEGLFVKNIENVQGDERDIIVFSTGYGPSKGGGKVAARFGPVGQEGGEHRLNVAITRAKYGVHVIASFAPAQLDTAGTRNVGPKVLERYLHYVRSADQGDRRQVERILTDLTALVGASATPRQARAAADRVGLRVRDALASRLAGQGLHVETDFGIGPYRLDLAVRRPGNEDRWACGIDCTRFLETADTLQRDVTEPAFWKRAGWRVFRVSPALWLERRDEVAAAIVHAADQA